MAHEGTTSTRIRNDDYEVAKKVTEQLPIQIVDVLAAWRRRWDESSDRQKLEALRGVNRTPRGRRSRRHAAAA